jgi:hypothetical protein
MQRRCHRSTEEQKARIERKAVSTRLFALSLLVLGVLGAGEKKNQLEFALCKPKEYRE